MKPTQIQHAMIEQSTAMHLKLSGCWSAQNMNGVELQLESIHVKGNKNIVAECAEILAMDTAGALLLHKLLQRLNKQNTQVTLKDLDPAFKNLIAAIGMQLTSHSNQRNGAQLALITAPNFVTRLGQTTIVLIGQTLDALRFIGETALALTKSVMQPKRIRWRPILFNIRTAGFDALPIVGLLSLLLGIVVAYQGADQLRQYGANIFVVDLVGLSMLREFAPLITAIIIAGRSGSAYAAQIGTMAVTEEIDAMLTRI